MLSRFSFNRSRRESSSVVAKPTSAVPAKAVSAVPAVDFTHAAAVTEACAAAGFHGLAARLIREGLSPDAVRARIAEAEKVRDICAAYGRRDLAGVYAARGLTADDARAVLEPTVHSSGPEIFTGRREGGSYELANSILTAGGHKPAA